MKKVSVDKRKMKKIIIWVIISFVIVFILRFCYEVYFSRRDVLIQYGGTTANTALHLDSLNYTGKSSNVASERIQQTDLSGHSIIIDQKYEKTANISSNTTKFSDDERLLRQVIGNNEAVVQSENLRGIEGNRVLSMSIGVKPDNFETLVAHVNDIGDVTSFMMNKVDRTEEYLQLIAHQVTLEKTRDSYIEIRDTGTGIQDLIMIERLILDVERELQDLGVNMGAFSTEYSFCTVNLTISEKSGMTAISLRYLLSCARESFVWTFILFIGTGFSILCILFGIWLILLLLNVITNITKKDASGQSETEDNKEQIENNTAIKSNENTNASE